MTLWLYRIDNQNADLKNIVTDRSILLNETRDYRKSNNRADFRVDQSRILVVGDSHSSEFANALNLVSEVNINRVQLDRICQGIFEAVPKRFIKKYENREDYCIKKYSHLLESVEKGNYDLMIITFRWFPDIEITRIGNEAHLIGFVV